jgi:gliding motility-associated protein GldC
MKQSQIRFHVELDDNNLPEKIFWDATDSQVVGKPEAKAINISVWDHKTKETLRIDLWVKDMQVDEMKRFFIDTIGGMAETLRTATGDEFMATEMENLCDSLVQHVKNENLKQMKIS